MLNLSFIMNTQTLKMTLNHPAFSARILHPFCELANVIPIFLKAQEYLRPKTFNCKGIQAWSEVHLKRCETAPGRDDFNLFNGCTLQTVILNTEDDLTTSKNLALFQYLFCSL